MSDWWIRSRYGYGAARLRLCPDAARRAAPPPSFAGGLGELLVEARRLRAGALPRSLPLVGILALGALCTASLLSTLRRDGSDASPLEIVRLAPPPAREPLVEPPPPLPEPVGRVAPLPTPTRVAKATPTPAVAPPPPPTAPVAKEVAVEPRRIVEPPRRPPAPVAFEPAPALASAEPVPPPLRRAAQPAPVRPASRAAPALAIDAVAAPGPSLPAPAIRAERRVAAAGSPTAKPSFAIDAFPASPAFERDPREAAAASSPPLRSAARRPTGDGRSSAAPPRLAFAAPELAQRPIVEAPRTATRAALAAPLAEAALRDRPAQALDGVPLSSLAACLTDAEEDALKLDVMAARGGRPECASPAGRYRFVETRNLNAFLLWVERAPSRKEADRCVELRLALECLRGRSPERTRG